MAARGKTATLSITIAGDAKGYKKATGEAGTATDSLGGKIKGLAAGIGAAYAVGKVVQWGRASADAYRTVGGEVIKLQRYTGLAAEDASGLRLAAQQSGLDVGKLSTSLGQFNKRVTEGKLDDLGLEFEDASGAMLPFDQILGQVMDRFKELPNGPEKTALAMRLFGRAGADLIPLLSRGSSALGEFKQQAEDLGLSFDEAGLAEVKEATKNQRELNAALLGMKVAVGAELTPLINDATTLGKTALPPVIAGLRSTIGLVTSLPAPVQGTTVALGGLSLVGPRVAGMLASLVTNGAALRRSMGADVTSLNRQKTAFAGLAAGVTAYVATTAALQAYTDSKTVELSTDDMSDAIDRLSRGLPVAGEAARQYGDDLSGLANNIRNLDADGPNKVLDSLVPGSEAGFLATNLRADEAELDKWDKALAAAFVERPEQASLAYGTLVNQLLASGLTIGAISKRFDDFNTAVEDAEQAQREEADATRDSGYADDETSTRLERLTAMTERHTAAVERRQRKQEAERSAEQGMMSALEGLADAREAEAEAAEAAGDNSEQNTAARQAEADATRALGDAIDQVGEADEAIADAADRVGEARDGVAEAIAKYEENLQKAKDAVVDLRLAEEDAALSAEEAADKAADARLRNTDPLVQKRLDFEARKAAEEAAQAARDRQQGEADAARMEAGGPNSDEGVIAARKALGDAEAALTDAHKRRADAVQGVQDAERRLAEASANTKKVAQDTEKAYQDAKKDSEDATKAVIDAELDLAGAGLEGEAAIRAQQTALREMALDYAPGSPYRQYIEDWIRDLSLILGGDPSRSPDSIDRGRPAPPAGDIPQDETRDPIRNRFRPQVNLTQNIYGSANRERRLMEQGGRDLLDKAAVRLR